MTDPEEPRPPESEGKQPAQKEPSPPEPGPPSDLKEDSDPSSEVVRDTYKNFFEQHFKAGYETLQDLQRPGTRIVPITDRYDSTELVEARSASGGDPIRTATERLREDHVLVLAAPPGYGKTGAAIEIGCRYSDSSVSAHPPGHRGVYFVGRNLSADDALIEIAAIVKRTPNSHAVYVVESPCDGLFANEAEGWERLHGAIEESNHQHGAFEESTCRLIVFAEGSRNGWPKSAIAWEEVRYNPAEVFAKVAPSSHERIKGLSEEVIRRLESIPISRVVVAAKEWIRSGYSIESLEKYINQETEARALELLGPAASPNEIAWIVAASMLTDTLDRSFESASRLMAATLNADSKVGVPFDLPDRLGRELRSVRSEDGVSSLIGYVTDRKLASEIVARFRRVHPGAFREFVTLIGHDDSEDVQARAAELAAEMCVADSREWDHFFEAWLRDPNVTSVAPALFLTRAYAEPVLKRFAYDTLIHFLLSKRFAEHVQGVMGVLFGAAQDRHKDIVLTLLQSPRIYSFWVQRGISVGAANYPEGGFAETVFATLAEWRGRPKDEKAKVTERDAIQLLSDVCFGLMVSGIARDGKGEFDQTLFDAPVITDTMLRSFADLLRFVLLGSHGLEIPRMWYEVVLDLSFRARYSKGLLAEWFQYAAAALATIQVPGMRVRTYWEEFEERLSLWRLEPDHRKFIENATKTRDERRAELKQRYGKAVAEERSPAKT
jgi:hypothetical protein